MMMSEFIERTGFEPTAKEYAEIEAEYMGCDIDKDQFCKEWKKNGGIHRLMRLRARRIEELEMELVKKDKQFEARIEADAIRYHELFDRDRRQMQEMEEKIDKLNEANQNLRTALIKANNDRNEAYRKLSVVKEAFEILGIGKEEN